MERIPPGFGHAMIAGCGIAGPALAIALRHAGIHSIVYEATPSPRDDAGALLNLAPNGLDALRALGLGGIVERLGFPSDRLVYHNDTGRVLAEERVCGVTLPRGALARALREVAMSAGVRFEFGKSVERAEEDDHGVVAHFADGSSESGRFLIGADGIHSRVRSSFAPDGPKPTYSGMLNFGGVVRTDLPSTGTATHLILGRRGFFGYAVRPSGDTYWFSNDAQPQEPAGGDWEDVDPVQVREHLLAIHRNDPPEVTRILRQVAGPIGVYAVYDMPVLPSWHRGSICLIGDAAHAVGPQDGQSVSLALEDAFVLAKCLRDVPEPMAAFSTFESLRRERVERVARRSRRGSERMAASGWLQRKVRDLALPTFLRKAADATRKLYGYPLEWGERVASSLHLAESTFTSTEERPMILDETRGPTERVPAASISAVRTGAVAVGALAVGSAALGALALGFLAVRQLRVAQARFGSITIDDLTVRRLRVREIVPSE